MRAQWESLKYAHLPGSDLSHGKPVDGAELRSSTLFPGSRKGGSRGLG